jgi:hypothetical protein
MPMLMMRGEVAKQDLDLATEPCANTTARLVLLLLAPLGEHCLAGLVERRLLAAGDVVATGCLGDALVLGKLRERSTV